MSTSYDWIGGSATLGCSRVRILLKAIRGLPGIKQGCSVEHQGDYGMGCATGTAVAPLTPGSAPCEQTTQWQCRLPLSTLRKKSWEWPQEGELGEKTG